jgi:outer membrane biosynthesis protein TonB
MRKFVFTTLAAVIVGCAWSVFTDKEMRDSAIDHLEETVEIVEDHVRQDPADASPETQDPTPEPTDAPEVTDPPETQDPPEEPEEPTEPDYYPSETVIAAVREADVVFKQGLFDQAVAVLTELETERIPHDQRGLVRDWIHRSESFARLLQETDLGTTGELPELKKITRKNSGSTIVAEVYREDRDYYYFRTPAGIKSRYKKWEVQVELLDAEQARSALTESYRDRKERIEKDPDPVLWFELANFSFKNGLNELGVEALELGSKSTENLLVVVLDGKAQRLYKTFWYFLTNGNEAEATRTLDVLKKGYPECSYIAEIEEALAAIREEELAMAQRMKPDPKAEPEQPVKPEPTPTDDPVEDPVKDPVVQNPEENPSDNPSDDPEEVRDGAVDIVKGPDIKIPAGGVEQDEAFKENARQIAEGNDFYEQALAHLRNSDPVANPKTADMENLEALEDFKRAFEAYLEAQDYVEAHPNHPQKQWLRDRVRDTNFKRAGCMKRAVYTRRK